MISIKSIAGRRGSGAATIAAFMIFVHADLRMGISKSNFDAGADFEVRFAVALQKQNEKVIDRSRIFENKFWLGVNIFFDWE